MFLSNLPRIFLLVIALTLVIQACGSSQPNENKEISLTGESSSEFPFAVKEPETYQADVIVTAGGIETRWSVARNTDKWRYDIYVGTAMTVSQIRGDKLYYIDHRKKTFWEMSEKQGSAEISDIARSFFRGYEHNDFDETGREGNIIKYKVRPVDKRPGSIVVSIDTASGMMVRQEFLAADGGVQYVYELRNLKLSVDDSTFAIPSEYRKVTQP
ncbi:MAG TPA: hypothetical protein PLL77_12520 [Pyrinomonadaceae bacterium]|nr:hypothetical protein [Pyrinomonadaceae bacterium]